MEDKPSPSGGRPPSRTEIRTLSPTATKILVVAAVILAFAVAIVGALYLINLAEEAPPPSTEEAAPVDTLGR